MIETSYGSFYYARERPRSTLSRFISTFLPSFLCAGLPNHKSIFLVSNCNILPLQDYFQWDFSFRIILWFTFLLTRSVIGTIFLDQSPFLNIQTNNVNCVLMVLSYQASNQLRGHCQNRLRSQLHKIIDSNYLFNKLYCKIYYY